MNDDRVRELLAAHPPAWTRRALKTLQAGYVPDPQKGETLCPECAAFVFVAPRAEYGPVAVLDIDGRVHVCEGCE